MATKVVVLIARNSIKVGKVEVGKTPKTKDIQVFKWTVKDLSTVLEQIKKKYGKTIRILLSEDLAFITSLAIPKNTENVRNSVQEKAQEIFPEDLDGGAWDFKEVKLGKAKTDTSGERHIQVVAVVTNFFRVLTRALRKEEFSIDAIEPMSYALTRLSAPEKNPHIISYTGDANVLIFANKGLVMETETFGSAPSTEQIEQFKNFIEDRHGVKAEVLQPKQKNFDPMIGLALKRDLKGKDKDVLNIELLDIEKLEKKIASIKEDKEIDDPKSSSSDESSLESENSASNKKMIIIIVLSLVAIVGILGFYFSTRTIDEPVIVDTPPTPTEIPIPTISFQKEDFSIMVLNGSGIPGKAGEVEELLEDGEFNVVDTGNADNYDFELTEIHYKSDVNVEFLDELDNFLENDYSISTVEGSLANDSEYDIEVIVGKNE